MPNTTNIALNTPNTGDLSGAWGTTAVNNNMTVIDGKLGGVQTVSLTNANVSLSISTGSIGTGSITAGAGPVQAHNAVLKFSGTLTGNCTITFPCPGYWIVENNCSATNSFAVSLRASGTGNLVAAPPGESCHVYNDGTDCKYVNMGRVGELLDLCVSTTPVWMSACTVPPYLPCVGTATYSASVYPALFAMLGSTFGGNGINTFGVPDLGNRVRVPLGTRITTAVAGFDGNTWGASGGDQNPPAHTHVASVTDPGHTHTTANTYLIDGLFGNNAGSGSTYKAANSSANTVSSHTTGVTVSNATTGSGAGGNLQPSLVHGVTFIKT